jgi:hypothetical protein
MQRGASVKERSAPPGIFETISVAVSSLIAQPLPLLLPIVVDLFLWGGPRLSPASLTEPLRRWLLDQRGVDAATVADRLESIGRSGDLAVILGLFVPSIFGGDPAGGTVPWVRPTVDPGGAALTLALALLLFVASVWGAMALGAMLARVVRGRSPVGDGWLRASGVAALRYLGFLALVALVVAAVVVPSSIVGAAFLVAGLDVLPLIASLLIVPAIAAYVCLAFVGDAIVFAGVGPLRACSLSFGVVRRSPWATIGLLLVLLIVSAGVARIGGGLADSLPGVALAIAAYAFVATGLALARMQFFSDRLRRWRADLVPPIQPAA